jgi:thiol-disulfide isomerase/thioredoxin
MLVYLTEILTKRVTTMRKTNILAASVLLAATLGVPVPLRAADAPAAAPAAQPTSAQATRSAEQIMNDVRAVEKAMGASGVELSAETLLDPAKRDAAGPKVVPSLKKILLLADELEISGAQGKVVAGQIRPEMLTLLAIFGDDAMRTDIQKQSEADTSLGLANKIALLNGNWVRTNKDAAAQSKVLDDVEKLAKAKPASIEVAQQVAMLTQLGAANDANRKRAEDIVNTLTSPFAQQMKEEITSRRKLTDMENKPIDIAGTKVDGSDFKSSDWKGKVILVDFWATWCGPCKAELPRVKEVYSKYHDKGFEVLGVSCDSDKDALQGFVKEDPAMAWPQLFDAKQNPQLNWHPLAKQYGINGIPTMFLIDKKGVLRTVNARQNFEEMIPKLLAE